MKTREFIALEKRLLPSLQNLAIKGTLMLIPPVEHTLRGFQFESSSFDATSFYVWAFFLPLSVPTRQLSFNLGKRVRANGHERWNINTPDVEATLASEMKKELTSLTALQAARDVAEGMRKLKASSRDPYCHEAFAYTLARAGESKEALKALDDVLAMLDPLVEWQLEMAQRARLLKEKLLANPDAASAQLAAWESESVHNLGLSKFR